MKFLVKNSNKIDLHIHTENSDGVYSVGEILRKAIDLGLEYIAFTDHDLDQICANGLDRRELKKKYNLTVINGAELTVLFNGKEIELLAYNYNPLFAKFILPIFLDGVVDNNPVDLKTAAKLVHVFGGTCVVAHPFKYKYDGRELVEELFKDRVVDGIECIHPYHTQEEIDYLLDICEKNDLVVTAGSDFHYVGRKYRDGKKQENLAHLPSSESTIEKQLERAKQKYCKKTKSRK